MFEESVASRAPCPPHGGKECPHVYLSKGPTTCGLPTAGEPSRLETPSAAPLVLPVATGARYEHPSTDRIPQERQHGNPVGSMI